MIEDQNYNDDVDELDVDNLMINVGFYFISNADDISFLFPS